MVTATACEILQTDLDRLLAQRDSMNATATEKGKADGIAWASNNAHYEDLFAIVNETRSGTDISSPDVIADIIGSDREAIFSEVANKPDSYFDGWVEGVVQVFDAI